MKMASFSKHPGPKLVPAFRGMPWSIQATMNGDSPLLAILELPVRSAIDLLDGPFSRLLWHTLGYLASMPDTRVYCGRPSTSLGRVVILVQLPGPSAWQDYQASAGLQLLSATLYETPTNRCTSLELPSHLEPGDQLDLISISLGRLVENCTIRQRNVIEDFWKEFKDSLGTDARDVVGGFLEDESAGFVVPDSSPPGKRSAVFEAYDQQTQYFLGVVCRRPGQGQDRSPSNERIQALVSRLLHHDYDVVHNVVQLESIKTFPVMPALPLELTTQSLIHRNVKPRFRKDHGLTFYGENSIDDMYCASYVEGDYIQPRGHYDRLATIYTGSFPGQPSLPLRDETLQPVSTLWLRLRTATVAEKPSSGVQNLSQQRFKEMREHIAQSEDCSKVLWACRAGDPEAVALFIGIVLSPNRYLCGSNTLSVWNTHEAQKVALLSPRWELLTSLFADILASGPVLGLNFEIHVAKDIPSQLDAQMRRGNCLELITFKTFNYPESKYLFHVHYGRYSNTLTNSHGMFYMPHRRGDPGRCIRSGFAGVHANEDKFVEYFALWSWESKEARDQWYRAFHTGMFASYERLGHIVDGLRICSPGGVQSDLLDMWQID